MAETPWTKFGLLLGRMSRRPGFTCFVYLLHGQQDGIGIPPVDAHPDIQILRSPMLASIFTFRAA